MRRLLKGARTRLRMAFADERLKLAGDSEALGYHN
jgi:hypothetical protein